MYWENALVNLERPFFELVRCRYVEEIYEGHTDPNLLLNFIFRYGNNAFVHIGQWGKERKGMNVILILNGLGLAFLFTKMLHCIDVS